MEVCNTIVSMHQGSSGLEVRTTQALGDADCVTLLCALALNLSHGRHLTAEELLAGAASAVGALRALAGPVNRIEGVS